MMLIFHLLSLSLSLSLGMGRRRRRVDGRRHRFRWPPSSRPLIDSFFYFRHLILCHFVFFFTNLVFVSSWLFFFVGPPRPWWVPSIGRPIFTGFY